MVRDLSATTTASASATGACGTPIVCTTCMPARTRLLARSVAPVKSSAMQPRRSGRVIALSIGRREAVLAGVHAHDGGRAVDFLDVDGHALADLHHAAFTRAQAHDRRFGRNDDGLLAVLVAQLEPLAAGRLGDVGDGGI